MKPAPSPWLALDALMAATATPTGPEWFTACEFAARYKLSPGHAHVRLNRMALAGKVEKRTGCGVAGGGSNRRISKFKLITK